ncbi:MAG: hypothetical protein ACXVA9_10990 [Bdellovibrionales bacterium]
MKFQKRDMAFFCLIITAMAVSPVHASQDCKQECKEAIEDCTTIAQSAEQANSDVASGMATQNANMPQGGSNLAGVSDWGKNNLKAASGQCDQDLNKCAKACRAAKAATTDPQLKQTIDENSQFASDKISENQSRLSAGQAGLASTTPGAMDSAMKSGDSSFRDQNIDAAQNQPNPDIQQVGCNPTVNLEVGCTITPMPFDRAKAVQRFLKEGGIKSYVSGQ